MAYTTYSEIEGDFKDINFTTSTNVTPDNVTQFIVEADAIIDAHVGTIYTVPVTAGAGLNLLKTLSRSLVVARIKSILKVKQESNKDANQNIVDTYLTVSQVMKMLLGIQKREVALAGATLLSSGGGFYSKNADDDVEPVMEKDERSW